MAAAATFAAHALPGNRRATPLRWPRKRRAKSGPFSGQENVPFKSASTVLALLNGAFSCPESGPKKWDRQTVPELSCRLDAQGEDKREWITPRLHGPHLEIHTAAKIRSRAHNSTPRASIHLIPMCPLWIIPSRTQPDENTLTRTEFQVYGRAGKWSSCPPLQFGANLAVIVHDAQKHASLLPQSARRHAEAGPLVSARSSVKTCETSPECDLTC